MNVSYSRFWKRNRFSGRSPRATLIGIRRVGPFCPLWGKY
jgi:hypothetical protein